MSPALNRDLAVLVEELVDRDDAFGLVADVDDDFGGGDLEDRALDDLAFRDVAEAVIVDVQQPGVFGRVHLVVVFPRPRLQTCLVERSLRSRSAVRSSHAAAPEPGVFSSFDVRHALRVLLCPFDCRSW